MDRHYDEQFSSQLQHNPNFPYVALTLFGLPWNHNCEELSPTNALLFPAILPIKEERRGSVSLEVFV